MPLPRQQNDAAIFFVKNARSCGQTNVASHRWKVHLTRTTEIFGSGLTLFTLSVRVKTPFRVKKHKQTNLLMEEVRNRLHIELGHCLNREWGCCHSESLNINLFSPTKWRRKKWFVTNFIIFFSLMLIWILLSNPTQLLHLAALR